MGGSSPVLVSGKPESDVSAVKGGSLCEDLKTKDRLYAKLPAFRRKTDRAREIIREAIRLCKRPYIAFSGGKDSEVVLHLAVQQKPDIDVCFIHQGAEFPDTIEIIDRLKTEWVLNLHVLYPEKGLLELLEEYGAYGTQAKTEYHNGDIARRLIREPSQAAIQKFGFDGVLMGFRYEESKGRRYFMGKHGLIHKTKYDGIYHVNPIAHFNTQDVWSYITINDLPYNGVYDKTLFQTRDEIRVGPWAGGHYATSGRFLHLKYYYPDLYQQFCDKFPFVNTFV